MSSDRNLDLMDPATGSIVIPQNVTKIGAGAFRDVPGLRSIVIPGTVKEIGAYAFSGNPTLENIIIEEGVETIDVYAFQDCIALRTIKIADTVSKIGDSCFQGCSSLVEINFPNALDKISKRMISGCYSLTEIEITEGIEIIEWAAFEGCSNLVKVKIPSTVVTIGEDAFAGDIKLTNIEISPNNENYSFSNSMLMSKDGKKLYYVIPSTTNINIPETVESIEAGALTRYPQRAVLNITKNVKNFEATFENNSIYQINVVEENPYFKSLDGNLYSRDMTILYRYTKNEISFVMPNSVKKVITRAFRVNDNLSNLTLSDNLEEIGEFVFYRTKITNLKLGAKVKSITTSTFTGKDINITISNENLNFKTEDGTLILSQDGKRLVAVSKNLSTYNIPSSVETIGKSSFYSETNLKEINLSENIKKIEASAFDACAGLEKIEIQSSIQEIQTAAFSRCNSLKEIILNKEENSTAGAPWGCPYGLRAVFWKK